MVVYDSVHGNTEQVAGAVAEALAGAFGAPEAVEASRVTEAEPEQLEGLDILVVGAPTHAFRPSPATRTFLRSIPGRSLDGVRVAAFDTRLAVEDVNSAVLTFLVRLFGYAAKPIADSLSNKGGDLVLPPEGFIVMDTEGPLREGELERAAGWAQELATRVESPAP
ncbi:MAG: flavodoxin domain-containing protein [Anaerolineae bacterium]|jgi:flavodoxin